MKTVPKEAGKSSFDLLDPETLFAALPLKSVRRALDLGCGTGNYSLALARRLPAGASVLGVDLWPEGIEALTAKAKMEGLNNVTGQVGDLVDLDEVEDRTIDLALMATVFHDLVERSEEGAALTALKRVLKSGATLAVVEFKKINARPGPPEHIRLSPKELDKHLAPAGFSLAGTTDLGEHLYLSLYRTC